MSERLPNVDAWALAKRVASASSVAAVTPTAIVTRKTCSLSGGKAANDDFR
jgi:hypothetical protein